jgi:hypothetical protein
MLDFIASLVMLPMIAVIPDRGDARYQYRCVVSSMPHVARADVDVVLVLACKRVDKVGI